MNIACRRTKSQKSFTGLTTILLQLTTGSTRLHYPAAAVVMFPCLGANPCTSLVMSLRSVSGSGASSMRALMACLALLALLVCGQFACVNGQDGGAATTLDVASATALVPTAADILPTGGTTDPAVLASIPPLDAQPSIQAASVSAAAVPQPLVAPDPSVVVEAGPIAATAAAAAGGSEAPLVAVGKPALITRRKYAQAVAALQTADAAAAAAGRVAAAAAPTTTLQGVLDSHNNYRATHSAPAMTWDTTAASGAASYAAGCKFAHDANRGAYGENLYATSVADANAALGATTKAWYDEVKDYTNYANPDMNQFSKWGHFTQVVWVGSTRLGCAAQVCPNGLTGCTTCANYKTIVVCRYGPPGNVIGTFPANVKPPGGAPPPPPPPPPPATPPPPPPSGETTLAQTYYFSSGTTSPPGRGCLTSQNGKYKFCIRTDANLVLYNANGAAIWSSNTAGRATSLPLGCWLRSNGQLSLFDSRQTAGIYWTTGTAGTATPYRLQVQNDGNVVIYNGANRATWATNTIGK